MLPRERRSLAERLPGFLTGLDSVRKQPSSIILSLSKERCGGKAGASKDEGCGLEAGVSGWMLRDPCGAPQHEGGGCVWPSMSAQSKVALYTPSGISPKA